MRRCCMQLRRMRCTRCMRRAAARAAPLHAPCQPRICMRRQPCTRPHAADRPHLAPRPPRWEWWTVWFQAALLLALFVCAFLERSFKRGQACFLAFFTICTQCVLLSAHNFITQVRGTAWGVHAPGGGGG